MHQVQPMADELGFWAYRLDNAIPADMRNMLVTLMNESLDPTKGVIEVMRRQSKKGQRQTRLQGAERVQAPLCVPKCMHVSRNTPSGSGGTVPIILLHRTRSAPSPPPPAVVEEMVGTASNHLVEELLGHKPREGDYDAQRRYDELSRFCVAANRL